MYVEDACVYIQIRTLFHGGNANRDEKRWNKKVQRRERKFPHEQDKEDASKILGKDMCSKHGF